MKILAVETSGPAASVALAVGDQSPDERLLDTAGRRNARLLIPAIDELLRDHSIRPIEIDVVAVSVGPGSFTGLRVGIVFAKTFAWLNDARLVAVDTLRGLAQRAAPVDGDITVISDAQRGDVFVNSYRCESGRDAVQPMSDVRIEPLETVLERLQGKSRFVLTGPAVKSFADRIPAAIATAESGLLSSRASALLPAAREAIDRQSWADPDTLEPVYLRRSYAEEKRDASP